MAFDRKLPAMGMSRPTFGPGSKNGHAKFRGRRGGSGRGEAAKRMMHGKKR